MKQIKMHWANIEELKQFGSLQVETYENGAIFFITDLEKIIYKQATPQFDLSDLEAGLPNKAGGITEQVLQRKQVIELHLNGQSYGQPVTVVAGPLWSDDESTILGSWAIIYPMSHKMFTAFDTFAPVIVEALPGGCSMYLTDTEKYIKSYGSSHWKYILPPGTPIADNSLPAECIRNNRSCAKDVPPEVYEIPIHIIAHPLVDNSNSVVGTFIVCLPRDIQSTLKEMAANLGRGLSEVSAAMEEMAASAAEVSGNQETLHQEIRKVEANANEINSVLAFIKEIADETKMLGLNAAIEAARAGEAGRGFGVVAEEIRKLSDQSKQTVVQIRELLYKVANSIETTISLSNSTLSNTEQVAATTEEINASLEEMNSLAEQLDITAAQL